MKPRPRSVERSVAEHLTALSAKIGASPVCRIPVLGREGPDITTNELNLVIDVKSRLEVPKSYMVKDITRFGDLIAVPLEKLFSLAGDVTPAVSPTVSVLVERWWAHMEAWTRAEMPSGISALVLHRPKMPIGKSVVVIHQNSIKEFQCKITR